MGRTVVRRRADSLIVQQLWEGITMIRNQRQVANFERISKYMLREYGLDEVECKRQLDLSVDDELMIREVSHGKKGSRAGISQDAYWCVEEAVQESEDSHDWYCFACHIGGSVISCVSCHRVFHPQCINENVSDHDNDEPWTCPVCRAVAAPSLNLKKSDLYKVLSYVLDRMKEKASPLFKKLKFKSMPNYYNLVYRHTDLGSIIQKVEERKYKCLEEFEADAQEMVHASAVYYGHNNDRTTLSQLTLKDCRYDLAEVRLCKDCYLSSNNRRSYKDWFCKPCNPPHELAWVHMRGFGFWPAKILARKEGRADVRFFGKRHERALVSEEDVRSIDTNPLTLKTKSTQGWKTAKEEMERHRVILETGVIPKEMLMEEGDEGEQDKPKTKGTKRKAAEIESEAEEFVRRSNTDAGQVNSISTSVQNASDVPPPKKKKTAHRKSQGQASSVFQHSTPSIPDKNILQIKVPDDKAPDTRVLDANGPDAIDHDDNVPDVNKQEPALEVKEEEPLESDAGWIEDTEKGKEDSDPPEDVQMCAIPEEASTSKAQSHVQCHCKADYERKLEKLKKENEEETKRRIEEAVKEAVEKAKRSWEKERSVADQDVLKKMKELSKFAEEQALEFTKKQKKMMDEIKEKQEKEISATKRKQWCISCEKEAMYHCCWNTSYCSIECQQRHWHQEHKRLCRRRR